MMTKDECLLNNNFKEPCGNSARNDEPSVLSYAWA